MIWIIGFVVLTGILYFGITSYIYGNDDYWPKQGVSFGAGSELGTFWERFSFKLPFHELDNVFYKKFKKINPSTKLIGIMEFRRPVALIVHPDLIKHVMVKDFDYFTNRRLIGKKNDPTLFDKMLTNTTNQDWKDLRTTLTPTFTTGKIKRMFSVFTDSSKKMTEFLKSEIVNKSEIDFQDAAGRYTMDVIASVAFGVDSQNFKDKNSQFSLMGIRFQNQFTGWLAISKIFLSILMPSVYSFFSFSMMDHTAFSFFRDVVHKTIKHRDATGEKRNDFLQLLMENREGAAFVPDENIGKATDATQQKSIGIPLTDEQIIAQCLLFFLAGFDGIETLLIFAAYELALNPDIQRKLGEELKESLDKNGDLSYETVNELEYLDMVVSETLRKYGISRTERCCTDDYIIPDLNIKIKKDQVVAVPVWAIHHDPEFYPDPEKFVPERFTKEMKSARNSYTYMPFGVGPRHCIAMRFVLAEGKTAIAHFVHNFRFEPSPKTPIPMTYKPGGNIKPAEGMWLKVTPK